jgi:hypothetical protein
LACSIAIAFFTSSLRITVRIGRIVVDDAVAVVVFAVAQLRTGRTGTLLVGRVTGPAADFAIRIHVAAIGASQVLPNGHAQIALAILFRNASASGRPGRGERANIVKVAHQTSI